MRVLPRRVKAQLDDSSGSSVDPGYGLELGSAGPGFNELSITAEL